jgi:molybdopterin/thiamine biosynthesis adenylyltransferase
MKSDAGGDRLATTLVMVGVGTIGGQGVPLLCRIPGFDRIVLVDPDRYESHNRFAQNICPADVGERKVDVMARLIRTVRPDLEVTTYAAAVEDVPMGRLRGAVMVAGVDSRRARQAVNTVAFRLGIPWIDGAVDAGLGVARIASYRPTAACIECHWSQTDYALLEQTHPCQAVSGRQNIAATNAPAELGALVAVWQANMVRDLLLEPGVEGESLFIDTGSRAHQLSRLRANPECRFDHRAHEVSAWLDGQTTLAQLQDQHGGRQLAVEGHQFLSSLACGGCRTEQLIAPVLTRDFEPPRCALCRSSLVAAPLAGRDWLRCDEHPDRRLVELGILPGDVVSLQVEAPISSPGNYQSTRYLELTGDHR